MNNDITIWSPNSDEEKLITEIPILQFIIIICLRFISFLGYIYLYCIASLPFFLAWYFERYFDIKTSFFLDPFVYLLRLLGVVLFLNLVVIVITAQISSITFRLFKDFDSESRIYKIIQWLSKHTPIGSLREMSPFSFLFLRLIRLLPYRFYRFL